MLVSRPNAAKTFAKQLGWQESLVKLFIFRSFDEVPVNNDLELSPNPVSCATGDNTCKDLPADINNSNSANGAIDNTPSDSSALFDCDKDGTVKHPNNLNLYLSCDNTSMPSPNSPMTPLYLTHADDFSSSMEDLRARSISRSSTVSLEDLNSSRSSQERDSRISGFSILSSPIDINASIHSSASFSDSRRSSGTLNEDIQKALDNLGVQTYLRDSGERLEEVCQNIIVILLVIMMKGIEGSNSDAWQVGQSETRFLSPAAMQKGTSK